MKKLTPLIFALCSFAGLAQEKGPYCGVSCRISYPAGGWTDYYGVHGYTLNTAFQGGIFEADPSDSNTVVVSIPYGDFLVYRGEWVGRYVCFPEVDVEDVDSVVTLVEGPVFPLTTVRYDSYSPDYDYVVSQDGTIHHSCLIRIRAAYHPNAKDHFVRVIVEDPVTDEDPVDAEEPPVYSNAIQFSLTGQQTLVVKKDAETFQLDVAIYSLSGQLLRRFAAEGEQVFDLSSFAQGCYIVQAIDENGVKAQLKFVR
jgi:hypothetical protein